MGIFQKVIAIITIVVLLSVCALAIVGCSNEPVPEEKAIWVVNKSSYCLRYEIVGMTHQILISGNYTNRNIIDEGTYTVRLYLELGADTKFENGYYYSINKISDIKTETVEVTDTRNIITVTYDGVIHTEQSKK